MRQRERRKAPSTVSVEAEAAEFRATLAGLRGDLNLLRAEISDTAADLAAFAEQLKRMARA